MVATFVLLLEYIKAPGLFDICVGTWYCGSPYVCSGIVIKSNFVTARATVILAVAVPNK